jgi:hypothetical protein
MIAHRSVAQIWPDGRDGLLEAWGRRIQAEVVVKITVFLKQALKASFAGTCRFYRHTVEKDVEKFLDLVLLPWNI